MKFALAIVTAILALAVVSPCGATAAAASTAKFHGTFAGNVIWYYPAGFEPDFDPIERVIIQTTLHSPHTPPMTLILDAYLENFKPDTTPILPDLIHPNIQLSTTLGGFFTGQAIVVAPSDRIIYTGMMLAEAFITPHGVQHMILRLTGQGAALGGVMNLDSVFHVNKSFAVHGFVYGKVRLPVRAVRLLKGPGSRTLSRKQILRDFNVPLPTQKGTGGNGRPGKGTCVMGRCTNVGTPAATNGSPTAVSHNNTPQSTSSHPVWMTILGMVFIGLAVILMAAFFFQRKATGIAARE